MIAPLANFLYQTYNIPTAAGHLMVSVGAAFAGLIYTKTERTTEVSFSEFQTTEAPLTSFVAQQSLCPPSRPQQQNTVAVTTYTIPVQAPNSYRPINYGSYQPTSTYSPHRITLSL